MSKTNLRFKLTTSQLVIIGLVLILLGNTFSQTYLNVKLHELLANVGALFLLVGTLQWFFDEDSRKELVGEISDNVREYLNKRDRFSELGISDCLIDSKGIGANGYQEEFIDSDKFAIGIHYSDGTVVRFEKIINERIALKKTTEIAYVNEAGLAANYLSQSHATPVNLHQKISQLLGVVNSRFASSPFVKLIQHDRVLRYSFIYTEACIWITFITNSDTYQPQVPTLRISAESDLFEFFKSDIQHLGVSV